MFMNILGYALLTGSFTIDRKGNFVNAVAVSNVESLFLTTSAPDECCSTLSGTSYTKATEWRSLIRTLLVAIVSHFIRRLTNSTGD